MPRNGDIRSWFGGSQAAKPTSSQTPASPSPSAPPPPPPPPPPAAAAAPAAPAPASDMTDLDMRDVPAPDLAPSSPGHHLPSPAPLPLDMASFTSSPPSVRRPFARDAVIAGSDDGDSLASDDSALTDVFNLGGPRQNKNCAPAATAAAVNRPPGTSHLFAVTATAASRSNAQPTTPRAKRTIPVSESFFSSPLTIQAKKHKYDMATLLRMKETDEAAMALEEELLGVEVGEEGRAATQGEEAGRHDVGSGVGEEGDSQDDERKAARRMKERLMASVSADVADDEEEDGHRTGKMRVLRALERTDLNAGRKAYYFFEQSASDDHALAAGNAFPTKQARDAWAILADKQDRARHFQSGFPVDLQAMFGNIPDEIFLWILNEVCYERRRDLSIEYVRLLCICDESVHRLVTPALLRRLFRNLGATTDVECLLGPVTFMDEASDPYRTRNWTCLENFLGLLGRVAEHLGPETRTTAMQILLRLGMDSIAVENFGLAQEWRWAVYHVARSVPDSEWTTFCENVCVSLYHSTHKAALRYRAISLLGPIQAPEASTDLQRRTLDLKRRLASMFFFDDLGRADKKPEDTVNIRAVIDRLEENPFIINARTDYRELHALIMLLNTALGDAARQQVATSPESCRDFDAEVDELAEGVKSMLTRVAPQNNGIHVSRIEAKCAMELLRERLLYQVRTRQKPKIKGIRLEEPEEDSAVPRQQDFMKGFFLKKGKKTAGLDGDLVRPSIEAEMMA